MLSTVGIQLARVPQQKAFETISCCAFPLVFSSQLNQMVANGIHVTNKKLTNLECSSCLLCIKLSKHRTNK